MAYHPTGSWDYGNILQRPGIIGRFPEEPTEKLCHDCGNPFTTCSRQQIRCDPCRKIRKVAVQKRAMKRLRERQRKQRIDP